MQLLEQHIAGTRVMVLARVEVDTVLHEPVRVQPVRHALCARQLPQRVLNAGWHEEFAQPQPEFALARQSGSFAGQRQRLLEPALPHQRGHTRRDVDVIPTQQLVCALTIQHDGDARLTRQFEHAGLRVNAGAAKRLVLRGQQMLEITDQITRPEVRLVCGGVGGVVHHVHPAFLADAGVIGHVTESVQVQTRFQCTHGGDYRA